VPNEKQPRKEQIKVTDKRIFTADGEIREEFRAEIKPSDPGSRPPRAEEPSQPSPAPTAPPKNPTGTQGAGTSQRSIADKAANPETPFSNFIEPLIAQAYMNLGMLPNPYQPDNKPDVAAARQMIEILSLLRDKTTGNLTTEEHDFLDTHLGELKLAFVKRTKSI